MLKEIMIFAFRSDSINRKTLNMRRFLFLSYLAISSIANAQTSILWEISGNGISKPSYLMGTLKFVGENEITIPKEAKERIEKSSIFVIEDPVDHHAQHELNKAVHFEEGSIKDVVDADTYEKLQKLFATEFNIDGAKFEKHYAKLKPLPLSITMTRLSLGEKVKFYDIELLKIANDKKVQTYSLEPIEREAEAINAYPIADQVEALKHTISNFEKQKEEFRKLMAIFPQGDLHQMFEYSLHPADNNAAFIEAFYSKRNQEWLPKIEKMVHDKPAFVAVGLSHLEGEQGLLKMLQAKGYTLTPVTVSR